MPLQKQVIPIPFAMGVDTKTDPKQIAIGKLAVLFNGVFQSAKRILKRFGYKKLSNTVIHSGPITSGTSLKTYENELIESDGKILYSYSKSEDEWAFKGRVDAINIGVTEIIAKSNTIVYRDCAYSSHGYFGYAYTTNTAGTDQEVFMCITDKSTGAVLFSQQVATTNCLGLQISAIGNYFVTVYYDGLTNQIMYVAVDLTTLSAGAPVLIANDPSDAIFDTTVVNNNLYICYSSTQAVPLEFYWISPTLVKSAQIPAATGADDARLISLAGDPSNNIWLSYASQFGNNVEVSVYSQFIASVVLANTIVFTLASVSRLTMVVNSAIGFVYAGVGDGDTKTQFIDYGTMTIGGSTPGTPIAFVRSLDIYGKAFLSNGINYIPCVYSNNLQPTIFIMDQFAEVAAKILNLNAQFPGFNNPNDLAPLPNVSFVSTDYYVMATVSGFTFGSSILVPAPHEIVSDALTLSSIKFNNYQIDATLASDMHLSGGLLWMYDGQKAVEDGFNVFPDYITAVQSGTAGGLNAGTYQYSAIYEWIDAKGNHHRSAPAPFSSVTITLANVSAIVTVPMLRITQKADVIISIYRTSNNGTTLRRVTALPIETHNYNNPLVDAFVYHDNAINDAGLAFGDILYTIGGEVENISPPACTSICTYRSRIMLFPSEQTNSFWYSKEVVPGFPVEFSDLFVQSIDELGGALVTGLQMDDKLIIFKDRNIFYMTGQGPSPSGANNDFSTPLLINTDVGCISKGSVVLMPNGIMFQSSKGIYLLDRSLQASYIGAEVEAYNTAKVTSAHLMRKINQVRFTLDSGFCLVYDYFFQQWSVFENIDAVDSCVFEDNFTYAKSDGRVYEENPGFYDDDGAFVPLGMTSAWLSFAGLQGFQRIYKALLLGEQKGNHTLQVQIAYDFDPTAVQTDNIDATAISPTVYQWRIFPVRQKCEAIRLTLTDVQIAGFNEGFNISDLTLEVGLKSGVNKLPASQSFG